MIKEIDGVLYDTDKEKKMVEDFVWDLKCDFEQLSNRYNYSYDLKWR